MLPYTRSKKEKWTMKDKKWGGSLVRINDDLDDYFSVALLHEITELWNDGLEPEDIGELYNRDPDEIFLALFHQARHEKVTRPFAFRDREDTTRRLEHVRKIFSDSEGIG